ncbi:hypothetical protein C4K16_4397 [Pseudomonas chlororaphis subsp. aurantiaca]|nr:hypothetical protein C4K16_4397 [Pseudomonas chlororaphis subsp. aurantiaca]
MASGQFSVGACAGPVPSYMQSTRSNRLMINNLNIAGC